MAKRSPEKQAALEKYLSLLLAAIHYNSQKHIGGFVCDGHDAMIEAYEWQRKQVTKYFDQRRLDRLVKSFDRYAFHARSQPDFEMIKYLKEKTGHDIDILTTIRSEGEAILGKGKIQTLKEEAAVSQYLSVFESEDLEKSATLRNLMQHYQIEQMQTSPRRNEKVIVKEYEEDGLIIQEVNVVSGGGSASLDGFHAAKSPDRQKRISTTNYRSRTFSCTTVHLFFPKGSGAIFQANVISPVIQASWKDDKTITIHTRSEYETPIRVNTVESYGELVRIEYVEAEST